ncbi:MAG: hypothetical protein IKV94_04160 [Clostridia bacterium]|nr:hypothetical protein [Clostridia bacterium]
MSNCLGIYIGEKVVKYAKLAREENSNDIKVITYGTKIHLGNKSDAIRTVVAATGSDGIPVCVNSENERFHKVEVLRRIGKADLESLIELEVIDATGNDDKSERSQTFKYTLLDSLVSKENYTANIIIQDKTELDKYTSEENNQVVSMYSLPYIIDEIVPHNEQNYLIINMNEQTDLIFVNNGKLMNVTTMDLGMKKIFDDFPEIVGSFQKSYDICKTVNVFSDESEANNPELENIIEPVLQDALNRIQIKLRDINLKIDKIYLTGAVTLFINSDMLFDQYFDIPTEKLRPYFIDANDSNFNMSEVTEANEAFALAYEGLMVYRPELDMLRQNKKFNLFAAKGASQKKSAPKEINTKSKVKVNKSNENNQRIGNLQLEKIRPVLIFANAVMLTVFVMYVAFSIMYNGQMNKQIAATIEEQENIVESSAKVQEDTRFINNNKEKYDKYTSYVEETLRKINNKEIGKYSTYNVALFMLKVSKYIPDGVLLQSIQSDSAKHITIVAYSDSQAKLGYLVSQLKLQGILEASTVKTKAVVHGETITVTIGGDLP